MTVLVVERVYVVPGEVCVWDVGRDGGDYVLASSGVGDADCHREPVSRLLWVDSHDAKNKKYNVSSSSSL